MVPKNRPSVPRERFDPGLSGAHWDLPEQQPEKWPRERSVEHAMLTPVFGTACPPRSLSGRMRRRAYAKYSEAQAAHWLMLIAADRVDSTSSTLKSFLSLHPDNPITETGVLDEFKGHPIKYRFGQHRADLATQALDAVRVGAPWIAAAGVGYRMARRAMKDD